MSIALMSAATAHAASPAVVLEGPAAGTTGVAVSFDGERSVDPAGGPLTFGWAIDGQDLGVQQPWLSVSFARGGRHVVTLTATDLAGAAARAERVIDITGTERSVSSLSPLGALAGNVVAAGPALQLRPPTIRVYGDHLRVVARCRGALRCSGTVRAVARVGPRGRPLLLVGRSFTVGSGGPRVLHLRLDRRARRDLGRHPDIRVSAYQRLVRSDAVWAASAFRVNVTR